MPDKFVNVAQLGALGVGKLLRVVVDKHAYMLANVDGDIFATDDMCTHEDASLSTGALHGECVSCPLHGSRFNVRTGEPLEDPATEPLRTYEVKTEAGEIYLKLK